MSAAGTPDTAWRGLAGASTAHNVTTESTELTGELMGLRVDVCLVYVCLQYRTGCGASPDLLLLVNELRVEGARKVVTQVVARARLQQQHAQYEW